MVFRSDAYTDPEWENWKRYDCGVWHTLTYSLDELLDDWDNVTSPANNMVTMMMNAQGDATKGRSFYITGLPYSAENAKLLYRAILWTAGKEDMDKKSYCSNALTEAHFYGDRYAITNNTSVEQTTVFYDMDGRAQEIILKPYEIKWIVENC